ncbi:hypothetical protein HNR12_004637 [Streptomonospora nanhaiensis]|uniref:TPM domain-containing protein n=2 Tax=Streptomonospora nanhaiensis TaxID=1323731 RepID=A0A853BTN8_9ACTN|nr:hypothetical protein [Streptomonospora nanhaiensis]NYI98360.1 hypothetical protein [Streptomonospora nanhaiensis]
MRRHPGAPGGAAPAAAVLVLLGAPAFALGAAPAQADGYAPSPMPTPPYVHDTGRAERVAAELREDPVYVDPEAHAHLADGEETRVEALVAEAGQPVFVAVLPSTYYDESNGDPELFLHALHHELGEPGVYVMADPRAGGVGPFDLTALAFDVPVDEFEALWIDYEEIPDSELPTAENELLTEQVRTLVKQIRTAPEGTPASPVPLFADTSDDIPDEEPTRADYFTDAVPGVIVGALLGLLLIGAWLLAAAGVRSSRAVRAAVPPGAEDGIPALLRARPAPVAPSPRRLSRMLRTELRRLAREIERAPADHPNHARAVAAFDAATLIDRGEHDPTWTVGAITMARAARAELTLDAPATSPAFCAVNPLHGAAVPARAVSGPGGADTGARPRGRARREAARRRAAAKRQAAARGAGGRWCAHCWARADLGRPVAPRTLQVRVDGRLRQHDLVDGFWKSVQYGHRTPDLARRVLKELDVD